MNSNFIKSGLLSGASVAAVAAMLIASPASAFDTVNWTWNADIDETITKTVTIDIDLEPTGLTMIEDLQVSIGDITADSTVTGITNNQPTEGDGGGPVVVDLGLLEFTGTRDASGSITPTSVAADVATEATFVDGTVNTIGNGVTANFDLGTLEVDFPVGSPGGPFDALTELPEVVSTATAVANNTSIETDTAVQLHEGQFAFDVEGEANPQAVAVLAGVADSLGNANTNLTGAAVLALGATVGVIDKAEISATSTVSEIVNASVDSAATAVANNLTVTVEAEGPDRALIGDVVQFALADVSATSSVSGVSVSNYTNLGVLDGPLVSSAATAVGNNKSISVSAPSVPSISP